MELKDATPWGAAALALPVAAAALKALWVQIVERPRLDLQEQLANLKNERQEERRALTLQIEMLQSESKTQQREYLKQALELARLSAKYERVRGNSSSPP